MEYSIGLLMDYAGCEGQDMTEVDQTRIEVKKRLHYVKLNDLYLRIERGNIPLIRSVYVELQWHLAGAYDAGDPAIDWWLNEMAKLKGWLDV